MEIASFSDANVAISGAYLAVRDAVAPELQAALDSVIGSPVPPERVSHFLEFAYANGGSLDLATRQTAANIGRFAAQNGFYGLGVDQRGLKMCQALERTTFSYGAADPTPDSRFVAPEPAPEPAAPPPPPVE